MKNNLESLGNDLIIQRKRRTVGPRVRCDKCANETTINVNNVVRVKGNIYTLCENCATYLNYELCNGRELGRKLDLSLIKRNEEMAE